MNDYYISLGTPLHGIYVRQTAESEDVVRIWASENLGKVWCSIYSEEELKVHYEKGWVDHIVDAGVNHHNEDL